MLTTPVEDRFDLRVYEGITEERGRAPFKGPDVISNHAHFDIRV